MLVVPGLNFLSSGIDIVTSDSININNFGNRNGIGFGGVPAGTCMPCRSRPRRSPQSIQEATSSFREWHSILLWRTLR